MEIVALVALVVTITQVLKVVVKVNPNIIAVVVSLGVVAFKAVETGAAFNFALLVVFIQVLVGAVGAFKVAQQVLQPK